MVNRVNSKEELPTVSIENLKTTYTEEGKIVGKLQAQLAEQFDGIVEPYVEFKKGISIVLYDKENKIKTSMIADKAKYYQNKKTWEATGNVVISNIDGDVLRTEKLYGDDKEKKIFTDQFFQIAQSNGTILNGKSGFESNTEFTIYQFLDVSGNIFFHEEFTSDDSTESAKPQVFHDKTSELK
jgi:LPS export ABC transporter protein LptC